MQEKISGLIPWIWSKVEFLWTRYLLYPIQFQYDKQFETKIGYVIVASIKSRCDKPISINKNRIKTKIKIDKNIYNKATQAEKDKFIYGETIEIIESAELLNAKINGLSIGNSSNFIWATAEPNIVYFLLTIKGPGSTNPSSRLQIAKIYISLIILIKKFYWHNYLEIPLPQISIIAGNHQTKIIDK